MGYSFSLTCKSKKARDEFVSFLRKHMRPWHIVCLEGKWQDKLPAAYDPTQYVCVGGEIAYGSKSGLKVGFNFSNSGRGHGDYMKAVLSFGALRVGRKRILREEAGTDEAVPCIYYDHQTWPVLLKGRKKPWKVDENGAPVHIPRQWGSLKDFRVPGRRAAVNYVKRAIKNERKVLSELEHLLSKEMLRLAELWTNRK